MKGKLYLQLICFSLFTGSTFHLAHYAVDSFSAASAAAWRFGIAALVMAVILWSRERYDWEMIRRNGAAFLLLGLIGVFGFNALFFFGMKHTSPVNGALIMATNPLLSALLARLILRDPITRRQWLGICFSLAGVLLVITQGSWELIRTLSFAGGDLCILAGNLCWALYSVLGRRYVKQASSLAVTTCTMIVGALALIVAAAFDTQPVPTTAIPFPAWGAVLYMAIFTSVLGYLWWNRGMAVLGVSKTAVFFNLVPVVTLLISVLLGSVITGVQAAGTFLVIFGVLTASGMAVHSLWRLRNILNSLTSRK